MTEKVYLVDGSGYIFRAYYAVAPLKTRDGFPTNALYGFFRMVLKLLNEADSEHIVMVFDTGEKTFRHELYPEYKANRGDCPEDLVPQMPFFRDISKSLGLLVLEEQGYEADDVIGTLSKQLSISGVETVIISGDKDLLQLVGDRVTVWDAMKDERYDAEGVRCKLGVVPEKVVELLGVMGDASDNIPGLKGVGPKTALQLIEKFGDVENILNSATQIREFKGVRNRNKIADQIESEPEILRLSRKLVEIDCNVPVVALTGGQKVNLSELSRDKLLSTLVRKDFDDALLSGLVKRFEFSSLLEELKSSSAGGSENPRYENYRLVLSDDYKSFLAALGSQGEFAFDTETTSLDFLEAKLVGVSFCWDEKEAFYVPVGHTAAGSEKQIPIDRLLNDLKPLLEDEKIGKCGQNLKYDLEVLANYGVEVRGITFDTMLASYLVNPERRSHRLSSLALDYLGLTLLEFDDVAKDLESFAEVPLDEAACYAAEDAHVSWLLKDKLKELVADRKLSGVLKDIELPLIEVLCALERTGVKLDTVMLSKMSKEFSDELDQIENRIYELAGEEFNINSPKQLAKVLYENLGIPTKGLKRTKTGVSTDASVLEQLSRDYELPELILRYRTVHKLKSTYVDALPSQISPVTDRLHSRFNQAVTATGRLSSSDPNLQNIPVRTREGRRIRDAFIAEKKRVVIVADYSQIELRLLAHMSRDKNLIAAFKSDLDIHEKTARELFGIPEGDPVSKDERRAGKTINFGIIYGMSPFRLAKELGIPFGVARDYIDSYFTNYSGVKEYFDRLEEQAKSAGYVTTLFGRRRNIAEINTSGRDAAFAMRAAINAPIQGSAADLIKIAMIGIHNQIKSDNLPLAMVMQVHDELVFEGDSGRASELVMIVKSKMESAADLLVPLKVDAAYGSNWQEAH